MPNLITFLRTRRSTKSAKKRKEAINFRKNADLALRVAVENYGPYIENSGATMLVFKTFDHDQRGAVEKREYGTIRAYDVDRWNVITFHIDMAGNREDDGVFVNVFNATGPWKEEILFERPKILRVSTPTRHSDEYFFPAANKYEQAL
ncbi:hypothetical protein DXG01_011500, partial [Tephrocybe rancida]